jgi:integrase
MAIKADLTNDIAVKALRWKEGDPVQFEVKDKHRKGFYIRISKGGTKRWYYRYTKNRKVRNLSLGTYPGTSCGKAFKDYEDAREEVDHDGDPYQTRKQQKDDEIREREKDALTLSVLFHDHYLPRYALPNLRTWRNDKTYFETKIEPAIGALPAAEVTPKNVEELIMPIERGGQHATARLTFATLKKMYNWAAKSKSAVNPGDGPLVDVLNPCRQYELGPPPPTPNRFFSEIEIGKLWRALGDKQTGRIAKLQLLTGCRVTEAAGMKWQEINFESNYWECPIERVKNKKFPLIVPLTETMLKLIDTKDDGAVYVFPARSRPGHTTGTGVLQLIKTKCNELKIKKAGTHTMRKTFISHMTRLGVPLEVRNQLTNHIDPSVDYRHYNFYDFYDDKKKALIKWDEEVHRILESEDQ